MNKIYKKNGEEISELKLNYDNGVQLQIYDIVGKINQLIKALSDKEEECNCCGWDDNRYTHEPGCNLREEPKQEECKQCKFRLKYGLGVCDCKQNSTFEPKQSTSLKEAIQEIMHRQERRDLFMNEATDKILSLIQSHLVKEIEDKRPANLPIERIQGYLNAMEDIIKIINNLTK